MIKNIIAPLQMWLLAQGRCAGCGMPLDKGVTRKKSSYILTTCKCKRVYIQKDATSSYQRAKISQI